MSFLYERPAEKPAFCVCGAPWILHCRDVASYAIVAETSGTSRIENCSHAILTRAHGAPDNPTVADQNSLHQETVPHAPRFSFDHSRKHSHRRSAEKASISGIPKASATWIFPDQQQ